MQIAQGSSGDQPWRNWTKNITLWIRELARRDRAYISTGSDAPMKAIAFTLLAICLCQPARADNMNAREVVTRLFAASSQEPPDLSGLDLANLDLAGVDFKRAKLKGASLFGADLSGANLSGCDLSGAVLDRATLTNANLSDANLSETSIRRPSIFLAMVPTPSEAVIFRGANLERAWLEGHFDFSDFTGARLVGARFGGLNPRDNQGLLTGAVLRGAKFATATMTEAILERADLSFADFSGTQLDGANLRNANLTRATFNGASLQGADLSGATHDLDQTQGGG